MTSTNQTCAFCGGPLQQGSTRCEYCGNQIAKGPTPSPLGPPQRPTPSPLAPQQPPTLTPTFKPQRKSGSAGVVVLAAGMVILVAAVLLYIQMGADAPNSSSVVTHVSSPHSSTPAAAPPTPQAEPVSKGVAVAVNASVQGTFSADLPQDSQGNHFIDHSLSVPATSVYFVALDAKCAHYDPLLKVRQNGADVTVDDNSGNGNNALATTLLEPGQYDLRVSEQGGLLTAACPYVLAVSNKGPPQAPPPTQAGATPLPDAGSTAEQIAAPQDQPVASPAAGQGFLTINTRPWTKVFIGGRFVGNTPLLNVELPAGRHPLVLLNEDLNIRETMAVKIEPGQTKRIVRNLR